MIRKALVGGVLGLALLLAAAVVAVEARCTRTFDAPYPPIHATSDPTLIFRYLRSSAICGRCRRW